MLGFVHWRKIVNDNIIILIYVWYLKYLDNLNSVIVDY